MVRHPCSRTVPARAASGLTRSLPLTEPLECRVLMDAAPVFGPPPLPPIAGRHAFYNASTYDGGDTVASVDDDDAIATDKVALRPGQTAGFSNVTSYSKGINGVMVDFAFLPPGSALSADDFAFRSGRGPDPADFRAGPSTVSISVRRGAGVDGSSRVTVIWPNYNPNSASIVAQAVANGWLEVTVKANQNTGLVVPDVFYFGNLIGEATNQTTLTVDAVDLAAVRANQLAVSPVTGRFDFNRDGRVNAVDLGLCRGAQLANLPILDAVAVPAAATASTVSAPAPGPMRLPRATDGVL